MLAAVLLAGCRRTQSEPPASGDGHAAAREEERVLTVGRERRYLLYVPEKVVTPTPLVVSLHGGGGTAAHSETQTGWHALADRLGFAVAYPDGIGKSWNDGRGDNLKAQAVEENVDDVAFLAAVIDDASHRIALDKKRVYMNGISNGAFMSSRFACERADLVAAIGLVVGTIGPDLLATCKPSRPVSVISFNSTTDPLVPFAGGAVHLGRSVRGQAASVADSIAMWVARDACGKTPAHALVPDLDHDDGSTATVDAYGGCEGGAAVTLYTIEGGGHTWPGGKQYLPALLVGTVNRDLQATDVMWTFFAAHPMNGATQRDD